MFSLNLPTTQGYVYCCLFGIFKVANETENAGQSGPDLRPEPGVFRALHLAAGDKTACAG